MSEVVYKIEKLDEIYEDIQPLIVRHWREIANYQDEIALDPDWDRYRQLEDAHALVIISCRRDGALIGYSFFLITRHIHYKNCVMAGNDVLFLDPSERKSGLGQRLITESERFLSGLGVNRIIWHVKPKHDFSPLLLKLGYMHEEIVMGKLLGEHHGD